MVLRDQDPACHQVTVAVEVVPLAVDLLPAYRHLSVCHIHIILAALAIAEPADEHTSVCIQIEEIGHRAK